MALYNSDRTSDSVGTGNAGQVCAQSKVNKSQIKRGFVPHLFLRVLQASFSILKNLDIKSIKEYIHGVYLPTFGAQDRTTALRN